jgi:hypothetical protein
MKRAKTTWWRRMEAKRRLVSLPKAGGAIKKEPAAAGRPTAANRPLTRRVPRASRTQTNIGVVAFAAALTQRRQNTTSWPLPAGGSPRSSVGYWAPASRQRRPTARSGNRCLVRVRSAPRVRQLVRMRSCTHASVRPVLYPVAPARVGHPGRLTNHQTDRHFMLACLQRAAGS